MAVPFIQYISHHQTNTRSNWLAYLPFHCNTNLYQNNFFRKQSVSGMRCQNIYSVHHPSSPFQDSNPSWYLQSLLLSIKAVRHLFAHFCWEEWHFIFYPLHSWSPFCFKDSISQRPTMLVLNRELRTCNLPEPLAFRSWKFVPVLKEEEEPVFSITTTSIYRLPLDKTTPRNRL